MAPLIPLPPMSTPNAVVPFLLGTVPPSPVPSLVARGRMDPMPTLGRPLIAPGRTRPPRSCGRSPSSSPAAPASWSPGPAAPGSVDVKSTPTDLVTEVDRECRALAGRRGWPSCARTTRLLGEEGAERAGGSGVRWLLDPIDGTVNFLYGLRPYAVSVAAERAGADGRRLRARPDARGRPSAPRSAAGPGWTARRSAAGGWRPGWTRP